MFCNKYPEDYWRMVTLQQDQGSQFNYSNSFLFIMAILTFAIIFCSIRKFAQQVTEPITKLTKYTKRYR